jgi:dienelactone hydrolase
LGGPDQDPLKKFTNIDSAINQQWVYHAVYNVALAHSLILSFKEVDKTNTGITGISWGGFLTSISAGLDNRYKAAVPVYGCGYYFDTVGLNYRANLNKLSKPSAERWIKQYDPSNFISESKAKFLWITGAKDQHFNPSMFSRTYNEVLSNSNFRIIPDMPHGHTEGATPLEISSFMNHYLKNDPYQLPYFESVNKNSNSIKATINMKEKIVNATLCFTKDKTLPFEKRVWETLPANVDGKKVTAQLPDGVVMWMIDIKDSKGMLVSSKYF